MDGFVVRRCGVRDKDECEARGLDGDQARVGALVAVDVDDIELALHPSVDLEFVPESLDDMY